jgi:cell division protein FtsQ
VTEPKLPLGEGPVPDKALEELLAAFANDPPTDKPPIDLDDPSIDVLLGLAEPPADPNLVTAQVPAEPAEQPGEQPGERPDEPPVQQAEPSPAPPVRATIKIGGGDDLPDALYLDEEAGDRLRGGDRATEASLRSQGSHGERTTILIADDDIEGASGGIPIGTGSASMDPRLRARRIAVKRAVGRKRLKWFLIGGLVIILLTSALAVLGSSLFAVDPNNIEISGNQRMSQADLDAAVARLANHPVLLIDTHSIEAQLERSPWVRDARVSTHFPHSATIEIRERVPLATYQGPDGKFRIIDVEGQVVDVIVGEPIEFMMIIGPGVNASTGTSAGPAFTHAAELVEALSPAVRSRTSAVTVDDTGALGLTFHGGATVVLGAPTELLDKLTRLEAFLKRTAGAECTTSIDVTTISPACSLQ